MRSRPLESLFEDVFDFFTGLLEVALGLIGLALGLEVVVVGRLTRGLLALALELFGLVRGLVRKTHCLLPIRHPLGILGP